MDIFTLNGADTKVLGIMDGDKLFTIEDILTTRKDILTRNSSLYLKADSSDVLDIYASDSDDLYAINFESAYKNYVLKLKNKILRSTSFIVNDLDSAEAKEFKGQLISWASKFVKIGLQVEDVNKMFANRYTIEGMSLSSSNLLEDKQVIKDLTIFQMDNLTMNSDAHTKEVIAKLLSNIANVRYENQPILSEEQEVFFYATESSVMPAYEDIKNLDESDITFYEMKAQVPKFFNYIGPFMNYVKGRAGARKGDGTTGQYVNGRYIESAIVAEIMNSQDYKSECAERSISELSCNIGGHRIRITRGYIEGSAEYDNIGIKPNEQRYFEELCKFEDMCLTRDILEAPINEWIALGLKINDYLPQISGMAKNYPLSYLDKVTLQPCIIFDADGGIKSIDSNHITMEDLNKVGLTRDVFVELHKGTPTSNKWFKYAINVALITNRYYTGNVSIPFGYDEWDFNKKIITSRTFDEKYRLYFDRGSIIRGNSIVSASELDSIADNSEADLAYFSDYADMQNETAYKYWCEGYSEDAKEDEMLSATQGATQNRAGSMSLLSAKVISLLENIMEYIYDSNVQYAHAEALIKLLRFGMCKPAALRLDHISSRVNLTNGAILKEISRNEIIEYEAGKPYLLFSVVTTSDFSETVKKSIMEKGGVKAVGKVVAGIGLMSKYKQTDGSSASVYEYYDIQTFAKDIELQGKIANFADSVVTSMGSQIKEESVQEVIERVNANKISTSIESNKSILLFYNDYRDKLEKGTIAAKCMDNLYKDGFNMMTFFSSLATLNVKSTNEKYIAQNKIVDKLASLKNQGDMRELLYTDLLFKFGQTITELSQFTGDKLVLFKEALTMWSTRSEHSLKLSTVFESTNSTNVMDAKIDNFKSLIAKCKSELGAEGTVDVAVRGIIQDASQRKPIYYFIILKGATSSRNIIANIEIPIEVIKTVNNDGKIGAAEVNLLVQKISAQAKRLPNLTIETIIEKMFIFDSESTKNSFSTVVKNML